MGGMRGGDGRDEGWDVGKGSMNRQYKMMLFCIVFSSFRPSLSLVDPFV